MRFMAFRDSFPKDFVWGTATAAYQIEGAPLEDGKGVSIWDTFSHTPGKTLNGDTGDVACDHYHRWRDDIGWMKALGTNAYRFSVAWTRVQPDGMGKPNAKGLEFYDRLVDGLLEAGIQPWVTLFHWDLPQALEDAGGWTNRDTAHRFAEYAHLVSSRLGNRAAGIMTLNEPWVFTMLGYALGMHAPGRADLSGAFKAVHHALLAHGLAAKAIRESCNAPVGVALSMSSCEPASDSSADERAASAMDDLINGLFADPIFGRSYPASLEPFLPALPANFADDLPVIAQPLDFLGINYYFRQVVREPRANTEPQGLSAMLRFAGIPVEVVPNSERGNPVTGFDWEVYPPGLRRQLERVTERYQPKALYITENGATYPDAVEADGSIRDLERRRYIEAHLEQCALALEGGVPLRGYFCWSLMDNFEWAEGYSKRFGLVHVDFQTQERRLKRSGQWYRDFVRSSA
jgi:beta-glucosidase